MALADPVPRVAPRTPQAAGTSTRQSQIAASLAANPNAAGSNGNLFTYGGGNPAAPPQTAQTATYDPYGADDPILAKIQAANVTARQNARTDALTAAKQLAIQLGDATGLTDDANTAAEAAGNPYSTLATLLKGYHDTSSAHDEQLNNDNLFFSGARVKQLGEDANQYQGNVYGARQAALGQYGQIQSGLASALTGADNSDLAAQGDAYGRAQQRALTYGYDPGQTTNSAVTNAAETAPAATTTPGYGTSTVALGKRAGSGIAKALARPPKLANPYTTGQKLRG